MQILHLLSFALLASATPAVRDASKGSCCDAACYKRVSLAPREFNLLIPRVLA